MPERTPDDVPLPAELRAPQGHAPALTNALNVPARGAPTPGVSFAVMKHAGAPTLPDFDVASLARMANELPNLQLLDGTANTEKRDALPSTWLSTHFLNAGDRAHYCSIHDLGDVPDSLDGFEQFHADRRERMRTRINSVLGVGKV